MQYAWEPGNLKKKATLGQDSDHHDFHLLRATLDRESDWEDGKGVLMLPFSYGIREILDPNKFHMKLDGGFER